MKVYRNVKLIKKSNLQQEKAEMLKLALVEVKSDKFEVEFIQGNKNLNAILYETEDYKVSDDEEFLLIKVLYE